MQKLKGNDVMVNIIKRINSKPEISSEENSAQSCRSCIDEILASIVKNKLTVETAFAVLDECKNEINDICQKKTAML